MKLLAYDLGSSFIKGVIVDGDTGKIIAQAQYPDHEMKIESKHTGWAEQDPEVWWRGIVQLTKQLIHQSGSDIGSVGISYQMHGLVLLDENLQVIRPSIIWCDSRSATYGDRAFVDIGETNCLSSYLNSPGNFTASKMKWVMENERESWKRVKYALLPGDYIALKLTGIPSTTSSGISEMILWDFEGNRLATEVLDYFQINHSVIPELVDTFTKKLRISDKASLELGLPEGIPVSYRAGDQPNNALSLNVVEPGEIATTAGTSGVIYGITDQRKFDPESRVNSFLHVNHTRENPRYGVLMCVNGSGILNRWGKENFGWHDYQQMNIDASKGDNASEIKTFPFGNGAERILSNQNPGAMFSGINLNRHTRNDIAKSIQEGICFAFNYGLGIMRNAGIKAESMRAGNANMFLSPLFSQTLSNLSQVPIELYNTDGAKGAALASGLATGYYSDTNQAFSSLELIREIEPEKDKSILEQYDAWEEYLTKRILN